MAVLTKRSSQRTDAELEMLYAFVAGGISPAAYCPPPHATHAEPSFLALNVII